jgi:hypothetical protein
MRATMIAKTSRDGGNCDDDNCPTFYVTDDGRLIVQGDAADHVQGVHLGAGESAVLTSSPS